MERFFSIITSRAIRRGSFSSVKDLTNKITKFVDNYNETCQPFTWTATADSILRRASRTSHDNAPEVRRPADTFPWRLPIQCAADKSGVQIGVSQASTALTGSSARNCSF